MSVQAESSTQITVYTIGHSNVEFEKFVGLLQFYSIAMLVDVRSEPYSKYAQWFNKAPLEKALTNEGVVYKFLGKHIGGKPDDPQLYDRNGQLDYDALRNADYFQDGINTLLKLAAEQRAAIMCSEEDPLHCHRSMLITPALEARGAEVVHIRHDGSLLKENELRPQMKLPLF